MTAVGNKQVQEVEALAALFQFRVYLRIGHP